MKKCLPVVSMIQKKVKIPYGIGLDPNTGNIFIAKQKLNKNGDPIDRYDWPKAVKATEDVTSVIINKFQGSKYKAGKLGASQPKPSGFKNVPPKGFLIHIIMQENPIYKFLKENNLTTKDENSFLKEYSDPNKAKELHGFLKSNNLTTKDEVSFYDTYFKKKNLGGVVSSPTGSQSVSKSFISSLPEQKSNYAPSEKLASESTTVVAPKQAKLISEANKRGDQITKEAIANSNDLYLKSQNKGGYKFTKEDPSILNNKKELEQDLKDGTLQVVKSPKTGKYVLAYKGDMLKSFSQAWDGVLERQANDKYVAGLSTEDKIKHYEAQDILNQDKYLETAPSGFSGSVGRLLGENAEPLIKLAAMANIGGKAAQAAGATAQDCC